MYILEYLEKQKIQRKSVYCHFREITYINILI